MKKFFLFLFLLVALIFGFLYVAINSSFVFDKIAKRFAPEYGISYGKVSGNALDGITLEDLYYKDKKLAREIKIKVNPTTLLQGKFTISHLDLSGVNEEYLEYMIEDIDSDDSEDNSSADFPLAIQVDEVHLSLLPFEISGIGITHGVLELDYVYYDGERFGFGDLNLVANTVLGKATLQGRYADGDLHLDSLDITSVNTVEIEKLFSNESNDTEVDQSTEDEPSIFIPRKIIAKSATISILPRRFQDIKIALMSLDAKDLQVDLEASKLSGRFAISLVSDIAKAELSAEISPALLDIKSAKIEDINLSIIMAMLDKEQNASMDTNSTEAALTEETSSIPYIPSKLKISSISAILLPSIYEDINISKVELHARDILLDIARAIVSKGELDIEVQTHLADLHHKGIIKDNALKSEVVLSPKYTVIEQYELPLRKGAIKSIAISAFTDANHANAKVKFKAKDLLEAKKDEFNLDVNSSMIVVNYLFKSGEMRAKVDTNISTEYTKTAHLNADVSYIDEKLEYNGTLSSDKIDAIEPKLAALLKNVSIEFVGDTNKIDSKMSTNSLQGSFISKDFKKGILTLQTKEHIDIGKFVKMPEQLNGAKAKVSVDMPIDFNNTMPLKPKVRIKSNIVDLDAHIEYGDSLSIKAKAIFPKDTLLGGFDKNIKFSSLNPMDISVTQNADKIKARIDTKQIKILADYNQKSEAIKANINLAGTNISITSKSLEDISITQKSKSIKTLLKAINSIYTIEMPDVMGDISLVANITQLKSASVTLKSKSILIGKDKKTATKLSNIMLVAKGDADGVSISKYALETAGVSLYANKPSKVELKGDKVLLSPLWINDMLKTTGEYNLKTKKGNINSSASQLKINHELADILAALEIKTAIHGDRISLSGAVHLKGGDIKYDMNQKSFAADSDIIILQRQNKKNSNFENNFKINMTIDSSKPLLYKKEGIRVQITPELSIKKAYGSSLRVNGKIVLHKGGYYRFENKKFILKRSFIHFKGKPNAPILDIAIEYKHISKTITIRVTGTPSEPSLNFSSNPHMSREQILSYILFDTDSGAGQNQTGDVSNLVAGTLAKSLLADIGLKVDHLVLSGAGFQVGKKISDKITIIYDQEKASSIKIRIENTKNIETDISFGSDSRSADIFYKKEF